MSRSNCCLIAFVLVTAPVAAHPVPSSSYDRTISVKLTPDAVVVDYRLEVNPLTVYLEIARLLTPAEQAKLRGSSERKFYEAFTTSIAPIIADRLEAWQGEAPLTFTCVKKSFSTEHNILCTFEFSAPWPRMDETRRFRFVETNFQDLRGQVDLQFAETQGGTLLEITAPGKGLKDRPIVERSGDDEQKIRSLSAKFEPAASPSPIASTAAEAVEPPTPTFWQRVRQRGLIALLDLPGGLIVVLIGSILFGAVHALQPGHGKTLVAAYLVGERGTVAHALTLGLVTTITHTGVVLIISVILWLSGGVAPERIQAVLGFISGATVAGLGVWLLLRRLAGRADHHHFFGGKHHHHGPDGSHVPTPVQGPVRWWNLILLGIGGGIVPCWDAIVLQVYVTAKGELWLGPPIILAFSTGLAATLVAIGILVVKLKGFGASRWGKGRFIKALPIVSALLIVALGMWLIFDAVGH
jgi:ABC-type nickel/cobalt efflux system permease component RcnA